ncbi:MAG TPA: glycosyl hydrolase family 65 protein [Dehalococcoidia bacterium]|nr:glycosyl hydrolase family 65 protein [Dehalococcoidia bacterium]
MITHECFTSDPWCIRECGLDLEVLAQTESIFALSNGHIGLRGNLDEGEPVGIPGTYLNGFYELRPLPYAEGGYGYPESGQALINVTNGKLLRLLVDDEPFDIRYGTLHNHERVLDLRAGTLQREVEWESPAGQRVKVSSTRLVSFTQRAVAAISFEVEAVGAAARVVVQSELVANEPLAAPTGDPRVAEALRSPLVAEDDAARDPGRVVLVHHTAGSGLRMAAAMDHLVEAPQKVDVSAETSPDIGRVTVTTVLAPGERLRIVKFLAYGWSGVRSRQALRDQVAAALTAASYTGWEGLLEEQRAYLDAFWDDALIEVEGDPTVEQAARFALFQMLQASARAERRAIPAKGLTGQGYDGHAFWDSETFVLPVLIYTAPEVAAHELRWRHSTLPIARQRARALGLAGAAFPWRTIAGAECSGYWPAGTAAFHINADIAAAVVWYMEATEDEAFMREAGLELLVETARLWRSLGHHDRTGQFRISGVTGPDEYSALQNNNVYTNLMAQQNLSAAADAVQHHEAEAKALGVDQEEAASWRDAARDMFIPYDPELGVHPQADGYTTLEVWDFEATRPDQYPLFLHFPYFDLYRKQVLKQADLVLAMQLRGDAFTFQEKQRNFAYYEPLTVRDSSLSAATQGVLAAEVGQLDLAYDYLRETALLDLGDLHDNTRNGLHLAALAGVWSLLVAGCGGMRCQQGQIGFAPRVPPGLVRLAFRVRFRGRHLQVEVTSGEARYELRSGPPLDLLHHGQRFTLSERTPTVLAIPPLPPMARPSQPKGREPLHVRPGPEGTSYPS